ncbi:MAG TPA: 50S ribosomal protein L18 [Acidimicrobiia bacterium]
MRGSREVARRRRHSSVRKKIRGTADRPRLAVYRSNRYIYAQLIDDDAGTTIAAASSREASLKGKTLTVETAGEVGKAIAARAMDVGITIVVFDRGGFPFHGRVRALAEGAREAGLSF